MSEPSPRLSALAPLVPQWPAGPGVQALCSTRTGGVSSAPWDSLNLGDHVNDDPVAVAANRRTYAARLAVRPVFMRQVHGTEVAELDAATPDGIEADACFTRQRGVACTVLVADCLPILLADTRAGVVAAAHAGWRGLVGTGGQGVLEAVMRPLDLAHTRVWLGPCIGPDAFEVGQIVKTAYEAHDSDRARFFKPKSPDKWLADLPGLARHRLLGLGLAPDRIHGNDGSAAWCTVTQRSQFFSHRRDRVSGRFAASIWLA